VGFVQFSVGRVTVSIYPPVVEPPAVIVRVDLPPGRWLWRTVIVDLSHWGWHRWWWPRPSEPIVRAYHAGPVMVRCGTPEALR
jgi:hypothetical protein